MRSRQAEGCSVVGCERPYRARGFCLLHYRRWQAHGDPLAILTDRGKPLIERFNRRYTVAPNGCWLWTGGLSAESGYSRFGLTHTSTVSGHRWSYEHHVGPIPEGWTVDHRCHNADPTCKGGPTCLHRRCVNPAHLEARTLRDNLLSGNTLPAANAKKTHCPANHPYDETNTYVYRGMRFCRLCNIEKQRRYLARKRAGLVGK
jgi:hypothetical protein